MCGHLPEDSTRRYQIPEHWSWWRWQLIRVLASFSFFSDLFVDVPSCHSHPQYCSKSGIMKNYSNCLADTGISSLTYSSHKDHTGQKNMKAQIHKHVPAFETDSNQTVKRKGKKLILGLIYLKLDISKLTYLIHTRPNVNVQTFY